MAVKKSELYSSLWASCDQLRGGMDASQYKDYVLVLLFIKYVSDKYAGLPFGAITVPEGSSFSDLVALKNKPDIGDQINKKIVGPLAQANRLTDVPDFNDPVKLGTGKEMVDRLSDLIAIFENPALDFSNNRADGDDILGDAYEYLMRHFASESGKSKGQFYTPAEVSRVIAQIIGIGTAKVTAQTTVYDPTCGSGSLLLKVADEAPTDVTLYGQEKDAATSGLARMNMILHNQPNAEIVQGNTIADPKFTEGERLKLFDYAVANPPFSDKRWSTGLDVANDPYRRFASFGAPPTKQGDYAYLLHIVGSLKSTGVGACILPHGVLFRGNVEGAIRESLVRKGYISAIVGLPPNLFYGTGIPACIVVIDKGTAERREGIFVIDASGDYVKDGPKNRLRARDVHKIVDAFTRKAELARYARMVSIDEIIANGFNLNIPRYIDSQMPEDLQDIGGHLEGGIPVSDIEALSQYWEVCPTLRDTLFRALRPGYVDLAVSKESIKNSIYRHPEFIAFINKMSAHFVAWRAESSAVLRSLEPGFVPKALLPRLAESLLAHYLENELIDPYSVYQHLMDYWTETMQDDCYLLSTDGWNVKTVRLIAKDKKGTQKDKGWSSELITKPLIVARYFPKERTEIDTLIADLETTTQQMSGLEEAHELEGGALDIEPLSRPEVASRLREIVHDKEYSEESTILATWLELNARETALRKDIKRAEAELDAKAYAKYPSLSTEEVKDIVIEDKWLSTLDAAIHGELDRVSRQLAHRVSELALRYQFPMPLLTRTFVEIDNKTSQHFAEMRKHEVRTRI